MPVQSPGTADANTPPVPAQAASALVLRPCAGGAEVLIVRRHGSMRFLGGYWVFPGGMMDAADAGMPAESGTSRTSGTRAQEDRPSAGFAVAAARELFEETGLSIDVSRFKPWAHWITPSVLRRRFDTWFFIVAAPVGQAVRIDGAEVDDISWLRPVDWAFGARIADFPITPPTQLVLRELAQELEACGSMDSLLAAAAGRSVRRVLPKLVGGETGNVVLPWDPEYNELPGEGAAWDAAAIAERSGWPSRLPARVGKAQ